MISFISQMGPLKIGRPRMILAGFPRGRSGRRDSESRGFELWEGGAAGSRLAERLQVHIPRFCPLRAEVLRVCWPAESLGRA